MLRPLGDDADVVTPEGRGWKGVKAFDAGHAAHMEPMHQ